MDFYIVNGGPRKKYNTVQLLEKASEGIFDELENNQIEDINIHQIRLYDLDFKGCKSGREPQRGEDHLLPSLG